MLEVSNARDGRRGLVPLAQVRGRAARPGEDQRGDEGRPQRRHDGPDGVVDERGAGLETRREPGDGEGQQSAHGEQVALVVAEQVDAGHDRGDDGADDTDADPLAVEPADQLEDQGRQEGEHGARQNKTNVHCFSPRMR